MTLLKRTNDDVQDHYAVLRRLRKECPTILPVRVRFRPLVDCWGVTHLVRSAEAVPLYFTIAIHCPTVWPVVFDTLLHEWSHVRAWAEGRDVQDHGPEWGVAYAHVYRTIVEKRAPKPRKKR